MSLTSITGSCRLLCYRTPVEVEWWLSLARARKYIIGLLSLGIYKNGGKGKWWPGRDMVSVLVGVRGCVAVEHSLVTLFSLSMSVKDRSLHKTLGKSQIYYPEHILVYERLEGLLLSCCGSGSFRTDCQGFILVEVLAPHWVRDSEARARSPSLDGDLGS